MKTPTLDAMATSPVNRTRPSPEELAHALGLLGARWTVKPGAIDELHLDVRGPMTRTGQIAAFAGSLADELDHHPRIVLEYAGLTLDLHTHDARAITGIDLVYAARLERWITSSAASSR